MPIDGWECRKTDDFRNGGGYLNGCFILDAAKIPPAYG
jgi:hypothetical protein